MSPRRRTTRPSLRDERGFTLIEILVVMVTGSVLVFGALEVLDRQRVLARTESIRQDLQQNARYAIDQLTRDLQQAGQGLDGTATFAMIATVDGKAGAPDSLYLLYADPDTPVHTLNSSTQTKKKIRIAITCQDPVDDLEAGDMLYLASGSERGVARINSLTINRGQKNCSKLPPSTGNGTVIANIAAVDGERHGWLLQGVRPGAAVMAVNAVAWFVDRSDPANHRLLRATQTQAGKWVGIPVGNGVTELQVTLDFGGGLTAAVADPSDKDPENDYDDINTLQVDLGVVARSVDADMHGGTLARRDYRLAVSPRNQMYTRNLAVDDDDDDDD